MICPKCDSTSAPGAVFCSRCGQSFVGLRDTSEAPYRAPAPYYLPVQGLYPPQYPAPYPPPSPYALVPVGPMGMVPFHCIRCGYGGPPMLIQKMSQSGMITMIILIFAFFPLFWIGLLMKETRCQCPHCRSVY